MKRLLAGVCLVLAAAAAAQPPKDSVYLLPVALTDQAGRATSLDVYEGQPVVITMFYGSCPHVCPMLIATIQRYERELPERQRRRLRVLLVSLDPARDTPAKLAELADRHRADLDRWTFARASDDAVRKLAAVLAIQYRRQPDGEINHSTVITLLDGQGRIVRQSSSMLRLDADLQAALARLTR